MNAQSYAGSIINWPRYFSLETYEQAASLYSNWLAQDPDVVAVYQLGEVEAPGLSDLDFVVVLQSSLRKAKEAHFRSDFLPTDLRYLIMHDPIMLSRSLFDRIYELIPIFRLLHRSGEKMSPPTPTGESLSLIYHQILNDLAIISLADEYSDLHQAKIINLRNTICRLNALNYPMRMLASLGRPIPQALDYEAKVKNFRKHFFNMKEEEIRKILGMLLRHAKQTAQDILKELTHLNEKIAPCHGKGMFFPNNANPKQFSSSTTQKGSLSEFFFAHLKLYAKEKGSLANYLSSRLKGKVAVETWDPVYLKAAKKRAKLLDEYHLFLDECGVCLGRVFKFGYEKTNVILRLRRGMDKLLHYLRGPIDIPDWNKES